MEKRTTTDAYLTSYKEEFCLKLNRQIAVNNLLAEAFKSFEEIIKSFDGKVINVKLVRAFQEQSEKLGFKFHVTKDNDRITVNINGREREMYMGKTFIGYVGSNNEEFRMALYDFNRINAEGSIKGLQETLKRLEKQTAEKQNIVDNFDFYVEESLKFEEAYNHYKETIPWLLQMVDYLHRPYIND